MTKTAKICGYCGLDLSTGPVNREHFIAQCFWGGLPLPQFVKMFKTHVSCNSNAKDDAEYLRDILVMTSSASEHPNAKSAIENAIINKMDRDIIGFMQNVGEIRTLPIESSSGLITGYGEAFRVDHVRRDRVLQRIIRGLFFVLTGRPMPLDALFIELDDKNGPFLLSGTEMSQSFGDDVFQYRYQCFEEDPNCILVFLRFYNRHTFGFVTRSRDLKLPNDF